MNDFKYKVGDVVKHKTSDFKMVIKRIVEKSQFSPQPGYSCVWYNPELSQNKKEAGFVTNFFEEFELEEYEVKE